MRVRLVTAFAAASALAFPAAALAITPKAQFSYTGGEQSYVVPPGVVLLGVAVEGGKGGGYGGQGGGSAGSLGALLPVVPGQRLFAEVGSAGAYDGGRCSVVVGRRGRRRRCLPCAPAVPAEVCTQVREAARATCARAPSRSPAARVG